MFLGQKYRDLHDRFKTSRKGATVKDIKKNKVDFLTRPEFLQETLQNRWISLNSRNEPDLAIESRHVQDIFIDRPDLDEEAVKKIQFPRRDLAMLATGSLFVYDIIQQRSFRGFVCQNRPMGLVEAVVCKSQDCRTMGACFHHFAIFATHNCPK